MEEKNSWLHWRIAKPSPGEAIFYKKDDSKKGIGLCVTGEKSIYIYDPKRN